MSESKFGALAAVVARDITEIADLPDFVAPPPGVWKLLIESCKPKQINDKTALVIDYIVLQCISLNDPTDAETEQMPKLGGEVPCKMGEAFWFNDADRVEQTLSVLKAKFGFLSEHLGTTNLLEILERIEGLTVQCKITNRMDKNDKSKIYASTRDIALAA